MRRLLPLVSVLLLLSTACSRGETPVAQPGAPVIVISIDTLRADRLPAYGYGGVETPAIDALRRDSVLFRNAWSHVPMTLPSHASILTGLLPPQHGVRNNLGYTYDGSKHTSIAKLLKSEGYVTGAAISAYVLRGSTGLGAEFDFYEDAVSARADVSVGELQRTGDATVAAAEPWLGANGGRPFFFLLHLFEPHTPYRAPEPFLSRYASEPYDGEVAAADAVVGRFLESLKRDGTYDRALIILLSDHGEGLGDHGEQEHGVFLYREALHVPLLVKLPGNERANTTVETNVQLIDVYPTIAQVAGVKVPDDVQGRSLLGQLDENRSAYSETLLPRLHFGWSDLQSLVSGRHHYIHAPRPELYDLVADSRERNNILTTERRRYAALRAEIEKYAAAAAAPAAVSKEEADKLAALGYIGSMRETTGPLPDPKDHIGELEEMRLAALAEQEGRTADAMERYRSLLAKNPRLTDAWVRLAGFYEKSGDAARAEEAYRKAIETAPSLAPGFALSLGNLQLRTGKLDDAAAHAQLALARESAAGGAHLLLARIAFARGDYAAAEREAAAAAQDGSRRAEAGIIAAQVRVAQGRFAEALQLLEGVRSAAAGTPVLDLESTRADALARMNRSAEAERAFLAEIAAFPSNRDAYTKLAILYLTLDRVEDAEGTLDRMFAANRSRSTASLAAETWRVVGNEPAAARWRQRAASMK